MISLDNKILFPRSLIKDTFVREREGGGGRRKEEEKEKENDSRVNDKRIMLF